MAVDDKGVYERQQILRSKPAPGPYYHGTNALLSPGQFLHPPAFTGEKTSFDLEEYPLTDSMHVYLTNRDFQATRYARSRAEKLGGDPHVYEVRPAGGVLPDPEFIETGFGSDQVITLAGEVVREVTPLPERIRRGS